MCTPVDIGRRAVQIRRQLEEGKPMDYEPMLPKDLLKVASKLSKEEASKVIDEELSKPKPRSGGLMITTPQMSFSNHRSPLFQPGTTTSSNPFIGSAGSGSLGQG